MALTAAQKCKRYKERHPEKFTAEARRDSRKSSDAKYQKTKAYEKATTKYRRSDKHRDAELKFLYGITLEDKKNLYIAQEGKCGICHKPLPTELSKCHVEHNHSTGKVRSLAHHRCNQILGFFEKTPEIVEQCVQYLKLHG
jgi:hypothetical protein